MIQTDNIRLKEERAYAEEQSEKNRQHELALKDKDIELEKYRVEKEKVWLKSSLKALAMLPVYLFMIIPLIVAVIRKHKVDEILSIYVKTR